MDVILDQPEEKRQYYTKTIIKAAAFFGTPLLAAYLLNVNFKGIEKKNLIFYTWITSLLLLGITIYITLILEVRISLIFSVIYSLLAGFIFDEYQKKEVNEKIESGSTYFPWWRGVLIIVVLVLALLGISYYEFIFNSAMI